MTTRIEIATMPYAERLNAIHRLRLLRNTTGELSAHTGIQLRNNSFSKKALFITRCLYSEFSREVQERTDVRLDELLSDYVATSRYYEKIINTRKAQPEFHREVLRCVLDTRFATTSEAAPYLSSFESITGLDCVFLTLLVLEILPLFGARLGDVDPNMHLEHLIQLRTYFSVLYDDSRMLQFAPFLTEQYQKCVRRIHNGALFTRLDLIDFTREVIANLENNYNPEHLLQANLCLNQYKIHPPLEAEIWVERDCVGKMQVCWQFEPLGADYILIRRQFDATAKQILEVRYELLLYKVSDEEVTFTLMRQSEVENLCQGKPIPESSYMQGVCRLDDLLSPQCMEWFFATNRYDDFPSALTRTKLRKNDIWARETVDECWSMVCETGEYVYLSAERVITAQSIYVECECSELASDCRRVLSWYRIPRQGLLEQVDISTPIAHIRHNERIYICFIPLLQTFDVTDDACRNACGIEIAEQIAIEYECEKCNLNSTHLGG